MALVYLRIDKGEVFINCFRPCREYGELLVAMLWESQEELETCLPDMNFWIYLYDDIGVGRVEKAFEVHEYEDDVA